MHHALLFLQTPFAAVRTHDACAVDPTFQNRACMADIYISLSIVRARALVGFSSHAPVDVAIHA